MRRIIFEPHPKQKQYIDAVFSGNYQYLLYGGAIRGGKSFVAIAILFMLCKMFPGSRWAIVRKDLRRIRINVIPTFEKLRPENFCAPVNKSEWKAQCKNKSEILFLPESIKDDPELNRFKGLEVNGFLLEEANELSEKTWWKAVERAGSWIIQGAKYQPPKLILLTTNPADNWVKELFYEPYMQGTIEPPYYYLPASIFDNPHISEEYKESLKALPPEEYNRFVLGDWSLNEEPDQLIKFEWVKAAMDEVEGIEGPASLGIDVARYGDDETVFAYMIGNQLHKIESYRHNSIDRTADIAGNAIVNYPVPADRVGVDSVGLGGGVVDILKRKGFRVKSIESGAKPVYIPEFKEWNFFNLRSQMWWVLREKLRKGEISIIPHERKLIQDLTSVRYEIRGDRTIKVESKDEIKKRTGRSTDYGDAFVYAVFVEYLKSEVVSKVEVW